MEKEENILVPVPATEFINRVADRVYDLMKTSISFMSEQTTNNDLLTIQKLSKLLCLSVSTCYGLVHKRKIPFMKQGKRLYFSKDEILKWLKEGKVKTIKEIEEEEDKYIIKRKGGKNE